MKDKATHELWGEEYSYEGVWVGVTIMKGSQKSCHEAMKRLAREGQYRAMYAYKIDEEEEL